MIFSDPTCDEGQCHWKQLIDACGSSGIRLQCASGQCYDPGMNTRGPVVPMPTEDPMQPSAPPAQSCAKAADCTQPAPTCYSDSSFRSSAVSYVNPACRAGACVWETSLAECRVSCGDGGVCAN